MSFTESRLADEKQIVHSPVKAVGIGATNAQYALHRLVCGACIISQIKRAEILLLDELFHAGAFKSRLGEGFFHTAAHFSVFRIARIRADGAIVMHVVIVRRISF